MRCGCIVAGSGTWKTSYLAFMTPSIPAAGWPKPAGVVVISPLTDIGSTESIWPYPFLASNTIANVPTGGGTLYSFTVVYEDETGINNIIFWPDVFEAERHNIIGTTLLIVYGQLQNEQGVIHVVAQCVEDYSHWVERLPRKSRDFH